MKLAKSSEEYRSLVKDTIATLTEASFTARWTYIQAYHEVGLSIAMLIDVKSLDTTLLLQSLQSDVGVSMRTLYYALKFYRMFPLLEEFPGGKNLGWKNVITKYLTIGEKEETIPKKSKLPPMTAKGYIEYTKNSKCVIGGCNEKVDPDHFPRTTGAGALAHEIIPLCHEHHSVRHHDPFLWWRTTGWDNRVNIFKHFYDFIGGEHEG